jgi:benzoyl-CoA reductase/2-hydroxyglutaryl-CoA dehydratase subunit BcrC/BadD/HgdB
MSDKSNITMPKIGITTTVPLEIILAGGCTPVDLNNLFMSRDALQLVHQAEIQGFPRNLCAWIKGLYSVALQEGISQMVAVTQGDCSNTQALIEMLSLEGVRIIPFAYPYDRDEELLKIQMERILRAFNCSWKEALAMKERLDKIRKKVHIIDRMTWDDGVVTGFENHYYQVCCSDMQGDVEAFESAIDQFMNELSARKKIEEKVRLGFVGVPPIFTDLYSQIESQGGRIVFNEVQRQFSMPVSMTASSACGQGENPGDVYQGKNMVEHRYQEENPADRHQEESLVDRYQGESLVEQYRNYTYPYDVFARITDIREQIRVRRIDGLIHYVQSFCFHRLEDLIIRKSISSLPILTLEGDNPGKLDARTRIRLESFVQLLKERKK